MDKVIVIGCKVPGYAVIRALAHMGVYIIALTYSDGDFTHLSKYVSEVMHISPPEVNEEEFINVFIKNAQRWEGALLLETSDAIGVAISKNKEVLSRYYKIVTPDWEILRLFVEKELTYALAKECHVPHPQYRQLDSLADLEEIEKNQFPCILRPIRSHEFVIRFQVKNFKVDNEIELKEKFQICQDAGLSMILQEIIPGPDENLYRLDGYINTHGNTVGKFFNRKLRQNPPFFGVMRVGVSTERYPEVEQFADKLLRQVNYRGYFSIEFKKDLRDGQLKLIENNCRLVRCSMLATASGVNHPWIIYQDLVKDQQVDVTDYRKGTYWIELYSDFSDSLFLHNQEDIRLRDYIKPYLAQDKVFSDLDIHDMKPFMELTRQKIRNVSQRLSKRLHL